jgi:hypothetical protein
MLSKGVRLKIVAERLGHSSIGVTGDLRSHVQPTVQREAVESWEWQIENSLSFGVPVSYLETLLAGMAEWQTQRT